MSLREDVLDMLRQTSRTFYIPISRLPSGLQEAVTSAYLCMRAIDEIEDHPTLDKRTKMRQLRTISELLQAQTSVDSFDYNAFARIFEGASTAQPEVSLRIGEWACLAPAAIAPRIWDATAAMAERMARWVESDWTIRTESDLDRYTFGVAGAVGLLVCDIGAWIGLQMHRVPALHFGRGLQAVNIMRNRKVDVARGVDFFPAGWSLADMERYARHHLSQAEAYARTLPSAPFTYFIQIPLALAIATLDALSRGEEKLSREAVLALTRQLDLNLSGA